MFFRKQHQAQQMQHMQQMQQMTPEQQMHMEQMHQMQQMQHMQPMQRKHMGPPPPYYSVATPPPQYSRNPNDVIACRSWLFDLPPMEKQEREGDMMPCCTLSIKVFGK